MDTKKAKSLRSRKGPRCTASYRVLYGDPCNNPATWTCPSGFRCDECAEREMQTIRDGKSLVSLIAPAEVLLSRYVRIN